MARRKYIKKGYPKVPSVITSNDCIYPKFMTDTLGNRLLVNTNKIKYPLLEYLNRSLKTLSNLNREINHIKVGIDVFDRLRTELREADKTLVQRSSGFCYIEHQGMTLILEYDPKMDYGYMQMYGNVLSSSRSGILLDKGQGA